MQGTMFYGPRDVRFEKRPDPEIVKPTDAIIKLSAAGVCGSDLCLTAPSMSGLTRC